MEKKFKEVKKEIAKLTHDQLTEYQSTGVLEIAGEKLGEGDVFVKQEFNGDKEIYEAGVSNDSSIMVIIDCRKDASLEAQGTAREVMNRVQKLRKKAALQVEDDVVVFFEETGSNTVTSAISAHVPLLKETLRTVPFPSTLMSPHCVSIISESSDCGVEGSNVKITLTRPTIVLSESACQKLNSKKDALFFNDVQSYVGAMDYSRLQESKQDKLAFELNGVSVVLQLGVHFFFSIFDKLSAAPVESLKWISN